MAYWYFVSGHKPKSINLLQFTSNKRAPCTKMSRALASIIEENWCVCAWPGFIIKILYTYVVINWGLSNAIPAWDPAIWPMRENRVASCLCSSTHNFGYANEGWRRISIAFVAPDFWNLLHTITTEKADSCRIRSQSSDIGPRFVKPVKTCRFLHYLRISCRRPDLGFN